MKLLVDTGVFSAALSRRRRPEFEPLVAPLPGNQLNLAAQSVAELRYGVLVAGWGGARSDRLECSSETTNVIQVSDALVSTGARFRFECERLGIRSRTRSIMTTSGSRPRLFTSVPR